MISETKIPQGVQSGRRQGRSRPLSAYHWATRRWTVARRSRSRTSPRGDSGRRPAAEAGTDRREQCAGAVARGATWSDVPLEDARLGQARQALAHRSSAPFADTFDTHQVFDAG